MLFICTGNTCRSPMAAALLVRRLAASGLGGRVTSAGLAPGAVGASDDAIGVMAERHLDISGHRSRQVERHMVEDADLVLGMGRTHVRQALLLAPDAFPKAFTLKGLVRRGTGVGPRRRHESLQEWLDRAGEGRTSRDLLGSSPLDEVTDPFRRPREVYEDTAAELDRLVDRLVTLLHPDALR